MLAEAAPVDPPPSNPSKRLLSCDRELGYAVPSVIPSSKPADANADLPLAVSSIGLLEDTSIDQPEQE